MCPVQSDPLFRFVCANTQGATSGGGSGERKGWLVLEGTLGPNGKMVAAVGEAQLKVLRATREEVPRILLLTYFFLTTFFPNRFCL